MIKSINYFKLKDSEFENVKNTRLYQKAVEIFELCDRITSIVFDMENDSVEYSILNETPKHIMENALIIPAKIHGAQDALFDMKMENAAIIRKCAREIRTNTYGFEILKFKDLDYLNLLRNEIEEFRILFAEWVKTFNEWDYIIDRWDLFNPPGTHYDDHDPDDDIPFSPDYFLGE